MLISQADGLLTICGLRDDLVAGVGESLDDVKADEGLVLSDEHPAGLGGAGLIAHGCDPSMISLLAPPQSGRRASVAQLAEASDSKSECCGFESHRRYQQVPTQPHLRTDQSDGEHLEHHVGLTVRSGQGGSASSPRVFIHRGGRSRSCSGVGLGKNLYGRLRGYGLHTGNLCRAQRDPQHGHQRRGCNPACSDDHARRPYRSTLRSMSRNDDAADAEPVRRCRGNDRLRSWEDDDSCRSDSTVVATAMTL